MRSILSRTRKHGTAGYSVMIRIKRDGKIVHMDTETFDRYQAAKAWMKKRETELAQPGALDKTTDPTLDELDRLMRYCSVYEPKRRDAIPMTKIILFVIYSTKPQEEITRMVARDLSRAKSEIVVQDMKNSGEKIGNAM